MQLERIAIVLRQRSGWEAIDLGFRMAVRWARPLWTVWFALFLPVAASLILALREQPFLAALALWWLKPAFDRFLLHVLGRATFGDAPGLAATLGAWRSLLGARLWPELLLRPFAFRRSFLAPVAQLEGQRGAAARRRAVVLGRRLSGHVLALAMICVCFEWVALIGAEMAIELLRPGGWLGEAEPEPELVGPFWQPEWWSLGTTLAYALAISVIEPFFVAAGFSLYLNRRVMLEGWDIELALRRLQAAAGALLVVPLLAFALATDAPAALAQADASEPAQTLEVEAPDEQDVSGRLLDSAPDKTAPGLDLEAPIEAEAGGCDVPDETADASAYTPLDSEARRQIETVLAHPDFGSSRQVERWRPRQREATERDLPALGWLAEIAGFIASGLRALAWIALAALLIAAVWLIARRWQLREPGSARSAPPAVLFGLAIAPESLPDDIAAAALAAIAEGRLREALSLLYRGALSQLVHARGLRIGSGATEGDVLTLARRALAPGEAGFFERLLPVWIDLAYAHREPDAVPLRTLCADYARHFQRAAPEAAT